MHDPSAELAALLDALPLKFFRKDTENRIVYCNKAVADALGVTPADMAGTHTARWYPEEAERYYEDDLEVVRSGVPKLGIVEPLLIDGVTKQWIVTDKFPHRDASGRVTGVLVFVRDASAQGRAEAALVESQEKLRSILAAAPETMVVLDAGGRCREIVSSGRALPAPSDERFIGRSLAEVLPPEVALQCLEVITRTLETKELQELEYAVHHRGEPRTLSARVVPLETGDGPRVLWSARDVTHHKAEERRRYLLEERIRETQRLESLGLLAGGLAHDFNNLLVGILGHADLLQRALPDGPLRDGARAVADAAERASELCEQLLAYSGGGTFVTETVSLGRLAKETSRLLEASISKNARVRYELADDLPLVAADVTQMRQILMNLITNASESLEGGAGEITIRCTAVECDREYARRVPFGDGLADGLHVVLEVTDTGCGMEPATIERIFDPFFTTKFTGRGLGLAAVLGIVRAHHGAIGVESAPGWGTTFRLVLPAVEGTERPEHEPAADDVAWRGEGTILIVDDETGVLSLAREMAEIAGYEVLVAADGRAAVERFRPRAAEIACVVLDLTMPGMDGRETLEQLRRIRSDVRVIFSSGYGDQATLESLSSLGIAGFIKKPYTFVEFTARLREVMDARR